MSKYKIQLYFKIAKQNIIFNLDSLNEIENLFETEFFNLDRASECPSSIEVFLN